MDGFSLSFLGIAFGCTLGGLLRIASKSHVVTIFCLGLIVALMAIAVNNGWFVVGLAAGELLGWCLSSWLSREG